MDLPIMIFLKLHSADEHSFFLHQIAFQAPWSHWNSRPGFFLCQRLWDYGPEAHPNQDHRSLGYGHSRFHYFAVPFWPDDPSWANWKSDHHHWQFIKQARRIQSHETWHSLFPPLPLAWAQAYLRHPFTPPWQAHRRTSQCHHWSKVIQWVHRCHTCPKLLCHLLWVEGPAWQYHHWQAQGQYDQS